MFGIVIILLIVVILRTKRSNNNDIVERLGKLETNLTKDILEFKYGLSKDISSDFKVLNDDIRNSLIRINEKVNLNLDENFNKTNKTFNNILERLSKIDEAQKRIDNLWSTFYINDSLSNQSSGLDYYSHILALSAERQLVDNV